MLKVYLTNRKRVKEEKKMNNQSIVSVVSLLVFGVIMVAAISEGYDIQLDQTTGRQSFTKHTENSKELPE